MNRYQIIGDDYEGSIGGYEIIGGQGTSEIIGAGPSLLDQLAGRYGADLGNNPDLRRRVVDRGAVVVDDGQLSRKRRFPIGFGPAASVTAGNQATFTAPPQNLFRTERFVVPSDVAFDFDIVDFKVGNESQFVAGGAIPAAMFTEVAIDTFVHFKTAEVGNQLSVQAQAINTARFSAGALGTVAR